MLRKLLKYDLKDSFNKVILIYGSLAVVLAAAYRFFNLFADIPLWDFISSFCFGAAISMAISTIINIVIHTWVNFNISVYGDRGYLTHTLPVHKRTIYHSKLLSAFLSLLAGVVILLIVFLFLLFSDDYAQIIKELFGTISKVYQIDIGILLTVIALELLVQTFSLIQSGLIGSILGHRMQSGKRGFSFLYGCLLYFASQGLALIGLLGCALLKRDMLSVFYSTQPPSVSVIKSIMVSAVIVYALVNVLFYFMAIKTFRKGVNLE